MSIKIDKDYLIGKIRPKLKKMIKKELDRKPIDFGPQVTYAIEYAIREFKEIFEERPVVSSLIEKTILQFALDYIKAVERQDSKFVKLTGGIRTYSSFFLIGAGVSFESELPLNQDMLPILSASLSISYPEKDWKKECLCPKTSEIKDECWKKIKDNPEVFREFKKEFKRIVNSKWKKREKEPDLFISHELIIKYFQKEYISELICMNWDNLIELEYKHKTGHDISKITADGIIKPHSLWKLNGDVEDIEGDWVLPYEGGRIFDSLITHLNTLKTPIFVIIGYSEREINISERLIAKLEKMHETYRIRPDLNPFTAGDKEISCTARYAMKKIDELLSD